MDWRRMVGAATLAALVAVPASGASTSVVPPPAPPANPDFATARPVVARHGMVVSDDATATRIGLDVLRRGGNAVDAAVAVGFALAVTLPAAGNLGGGGFMLVHRADLGKTAAIDYRETAPAATTKDVFLDPNGEPDPFKSRFSGLAVGVPGTVAGFWLAWKRYGSGKLAFADLVAPAAAIARRGLPVDETLAASLAAARKRIARYPSAAKIYLKPDGSAPKAGDRIALGDLAATLDAIGAHGPDAFYHGPVAERIAAAVEAAGGRMTAADLAAYRAIEREPVRGTYRGAEIVSMPPPSSGGVHVIEILNVLEGFPLAAEGLGSAKEIHDVSEAEKLAFADRARWLGDPAFTKIPMAGLVSKDYAAALRATIPADRARPGKEIMPGDPGRYESPQTTHFSVVDGEGNAVS
ncbi:MAG: gamma-glutamyltransferase, partial [Hyphomicrobiales bacterium]|nr:gamma-glutamyltransferase [Hyphomicrobiales bacterium]